MRAPRPIVVFCFLGWATALLLCCVVWYLDKNPVTVTQVVSQDTQLKADADDLGIDVSGINLAFNDNQQSYNLKPGEISYGLYIGPNSIQIKPNQSHQEELKLLSYEYMHYVWWERLSDAQRAGQANLYQTLYDTNDSFKQLMRFYSGNIDDERDATACTRLPRDQLSDQINIFCDTWIPERNLVI